MMLDRLRNPGASEGLEIVLKIADNLGVEAKPMASVLSAWAKGNPRVNETLKQIGAEPVP
jgi:hypothetical protein